MAELLSSLGGGGALGGMMGGAGSAGGAIDGISGAGASQGLLGGGAQANPMQGLLGDMTSGEQGEVYASLDQRNKGGNRDRAKMAEQNPYTQDMSQFAQSGKGMSDLAKLMAFAQMRR